MCVCVCFKERQTAMLFVLRDEQAHFFPLIHLKSGRKTFFLVVLSSKGVAFYFHIRMLVLKNPIYPHSKKKKNHEIFRTGGI